MRALIPIALLTLWLLQPAVGDDTISPNHVPDASFESELPLWLPQDQKSYYLDRRRSPTAADGRTVMLLTGWHGGAATIVSPVLNVPPRPASITGKVRHRGEAGQLTVELVLYDENAGRILGRCEPWQADGRDAWHAMSRENIWVGDSLSGLLDDLDNLGETLGEGAQAAAVKVRIGLLVRGPQRGHELEFDQLGLFSGTQVGEVTDNAVAISLLPEELSLTEGASLTEAAALYEGGPTASELVMQGARDAATASIEVPSAGRYRLWCRLRSSGRNRMEKHLSVQVSQGTIDQAAPLDEVDYGKDGVAGWYWSSVSVELHAGPARIRLAPAGKPPAKLHLSRLLLTANPDYVPRDNDLLTTPAYMRFINESAGQEPFLLWVYIGTHNIKSPHQHMGMYTLSGIVGYFPPKDRDLFIQPGDTTPWLALHDVLFGDQWTHRNNLRLTATRETRLGGHLTGLFKGRLEFAAGPERTIIKTVPIEQHSPVIEMTLPYDVGRHPEEVMAPMDYLRQKQAVLATLPERQGPNARHLQIIVNNPSADTAARELAEGELELVKTLGANTIRRVPASRQAVRFHEEHQMTPRYTLDLHSVWGMLTENSMYHPDLAKIEESFAKAAEAHAETREQIARIILADEPGGMTHEAMRNSPQTQKSFESYLATVGLRDQLDAHFDDLLGDSASFEPFDPTEDPDRKLAQPKFFYHMEIFRLQAMGHLVREFTRVKNKHFPSSARTLVNHVPYHSAYGSWVKRGVDPYFCFGKDGLELPWTEDWMAYGAGPQEISPLYALLRSAGRANGSPLGGYVVVKDGDAQLVRMKLYTALAGGMREIDLYNYDPPYSGWLNSWSEQFEKYPALQQTLQEFGAIDEPLHGTIRRPTDIAILYNRTQAIWANPGYTAYYDIDLVHWALAHAGYDADYLSEEDLEAGLLDQYKLLYLGGEHVKQSCADAIAAWVSRGGILCAQTGAGVWNEFHAPRTEWESLFGAKMDEGRDTGVSLPRLKMKQMEPLDQLTTAPPAGLPACTFPNYSYSERLQPTTATVFLTTGEGKPAGIVNRHGEGQAIRFAGAPGIAYLRSAVKGDAYEVKSFLPRAFDPRLRELIAWPAAMAGARRIVETDEPILEVVRYDKPGTSVLLLIDHDARPKESVVLRLPDAGGFTRAWTATGQPVTLSVTGDTVQLTLPLDTCEAIVLQP